MAKTKRKKDYRFIHELLSCLEIIIGIVFILLIFSPVIGFNNRMNNNNYLTFLGYEIIFNYSYSIEITNLTYYLWGFSFLNMIPYILIFIATILNVVKLYKYKINTLITNIILTCLYIISAILIINCINLTNFSSDSSSLILLFGILDISDFSLAFGAITMGILGFVGGTLTLSEIVLKLCDKH